VNTFLKTLQYFFIITAELTLLFIGISAIVALILIYIPQEKLKKWLSHRGVWGNFLGAFVGSLTPFCACSTVPMTLGLLNAGAPFGAIMSFVIASPLLNPIIITMIFALMGIKASLIYFGVTFFTSVIFGFIIEKLGFVKYLKNVRLKKPNSNQKENIASKKLLDNIRTAFITALKDFKSVFGYLLIGVGIGACIYGYLPEDFITKIAGSNNFFAIPVAATIGIPLYIRAETAIPIGLALLKKGMSIGAVIALIIGGAGMAIPEMIMLSSIFKKRLVAVMVIVIWLTAVLGGYFFNLIL